MVIGQEKAIGTYLENTLSFGSKKYEENLAKESMMVVEKPGEYDDCFKKKVMIH